MKLADSFATHYKYKVKQNIHFLESGQFWGQIMSIFKAWPKSFITQNT
jgi:hypothetical protein